MYRAVNAYGESDFSEELNAGVGAFPPKMNSVRKVRTTLSSITLEWDSVVGSELPVLGYRLNINDGLGGD